MGSMSNTFIDQIKEDLEKYTEVESFLRDYYQKNHDYCTPNVMMENQAIFRAFYEAAVESYTYADNNKHGTYELRENGFFRQNEDVVMNKPPRYFRPAEHLHTFFEILYVYSGHCLNRIDNQEIDMQAGNICIVPPMVAHSICHNDDSIVVNILVRSSSFNRAFAVLLSADDILGNFFNEILYSNKYRKYVLFRADIDDQLQYILLNMYHIFNKREQNYERVLGGFLLAFLGILLQRHEGSVEYPTGYFIANNIAPQIVNYISKNCSSITLSECANQFHFNERYLASILKKETKKTFPQLITQARMIKAKQKLSDLSLTLNEIAEDLGYYDASYFIRVFKKEYGCTPSQYREMHQEVSDG